MFFNLFWGFLYLLYLFYFTKIYSFFLIEIFSSQNNVNDDFLFHGEEMYH